MARFQSSPVSEAPLGRCSICDQVLLAEKRICVDCSRQPWSFPEVQGFFGYQEPQAELFRHYKFGGSSALVWSWARAFGPRFWPPGPLVPVPPLRSHVWSRGWDPVATFAFAVAKQTGQPVLKVLKRRASASQKSLDQNARLQNAARAYRLAPLAGRCLLGLRTVWLVDDVVTTGATVEACASLLKKSGVGEVRVLCLGLH